MVIKFVKISWCICVVLSWNELKVRQNLLDSDYEIYMVRLLVAAVNWHKSLQFAKKPNITLLPCLFIKAQVALLPKPKIRQPKNFRKVETATGRAEKCDTIFESHYRNTQICQNKHSWSDFISGAYCAVININPNRAFWFAFALLLLQIIDMQHLAFHPVSEMYVEFVLSLTHGPFLAQPNYGLVFITWALCSSCGHLSYCFFFFLCQTFSWPEAPLPHLLDYRTD